MSTVRFFAAAEEAAGSGREERSETTVGALRAGLVADHPALGAILDRCAVLVDGARRDDHAPVGAASTVDILPPFAGG